MSFRSSISSVGCLAGLMAGLEAGEIDVVILAGDPLPDGNGIYTDRASRMEEPLLGNDGMVLFFSEVLASADNSSGALSFASRDLGAVVARESQSESILLGIGVEGFTNLGGANQYALGDRGVTGFISNVMNGGDVLLNTGITATGPILQAVDGFFSPDEGNINFIGNAGFNMNGSGQTAFVVGLQGTDGGLSDNRGILRFDVNPQQVVSIGQKGDPMPASSGVYLPVEKAPAINAAGQVAFLADVEGAPSNSAEVILRGDGTALVEMIRSGMLLPGGGSIREFAAAAGGAIGLNDSGHVAASVENTSGGGGNAVVLATSPGSLSEVARVGQPVPEHPFTFRSFGPHVMLNHQGDCVFQADLTPVGSGSIGEALFRNTEVVVLEESLVPDGTGTFDHLGFSEFALNERGDIALFVEIDLTAGGSVDGLFICLADDGIAEIIRVGDPLAGGTVTAIEFAGSSANNGSVPLSRNGINDLGQVAFKFTLDGDIDGIAIWSPDSVERAQPLSPTIQRIADNQYQLQFPGLPGVPYQLQRQASLTPEGWIDLDGPAFTSPQGILSVSHSSTLDREFFRLVYAD